MLLCILGSNLLGNLLADKGTSTLGEYTIRAGERY